MKSSSTSQSQTESDNILTFLCTKAIATRNPWLASYLLWQAQRAAIFIKQLRAFSQAMRPTKQLVVSTVTGAALILGAAAPALAGTITVDSTTDDTTGCTLREAIVAANLDTDYGGCTISGAGPDDIIDLTTISGTIAITSSLPGISQTVQINGPGASSLTLDGNGHTGIIGAETGTNIGIDGLTISNVSGHGVEAYNDATISNSIITGANCGVYTINGDAFVDKSTITGQGCAGIAAFGGATVTDSVVTGNIDGIVTTLGAITVTNSYITGQTYQGMYAKGHLTVTNSSIVGANYGFRAFGPAEVNNSTITGEVDNGADSFSNITIISSTITAGYEAVYSVTGDILIIDSTLTGNDDDAVDAETGSVTVINSTLTGGDDGIDTETGPVTVIRSKVTGSDKGITADGQATVISSTISSSTSYGVYAETNATISYSTITAGLDGVAAKNDVSVNSSTISSSGRHGVQSVSRQSVTIAHSTIANSVGFGVVNPGGVSTVISHTIVAGNSGSGTTRDINATLDTNSGYNVIGNGDTTGLTNGVNGNQIGTTGTLLDAQLGPLADNGGETQTHLPDITSPALNSGDPNFSMPPVNDQRGNGFTRIVDEIIDVGAVENTIKGKFYFPSIYKS